MSAELLIFKAGKYPQGDWPKERVRKMVDAYDPEKNLEAPVVIGHKWYSQTNEDQFAHGWVKSLRMDGAGKVFAVVDDFSADVKKAVAEKKLRYISAEFYEDDRHDDSRPPYLKAIALLGRDTPAVQGAKLPVLFSQGVMSVLDEQEHISAFTRKLGDNEFGLFVQSPVSADDRAVFTGAAAGTGGAEHQDQEVQHMDELEQLKTQSERLSTELAAANEKIAAFQKETESRRNDERKAGAEAFFATLRDGGKLPPALFEKAVALDVRLGTEERTELRAVFSAMTATVDLSGTHAAPKDKAAKGGEGTVTAKIRAFQKEKGFTSFAEAAEVFYAANPAAFDAEVGVASAGGGE
jgi:hypothetical protein